MWQIHPEPVNLLQYLHRIPLCFYAWIPIPPYALSRHSANHSTRPNLLLLSKYPFRNIVQEPKLPPFCRQPCPKGLVQGADLLKVFRSCVPVIRHSFADNQACQNKQSLRLHRKTLPYENAYNPNKPVSWKVYLSPLKIPQVLFLLRFLHYYP